MAIFEMYVKFPCGYEFNAKVSSWFADVSVSNIPEECPLHGKNCPPAKEVK